MKTFFDNSDWVHSEMQRQKKENKYFGWIGILVAILVFCLMVLLIAYLPS